MLFKLLWIVVIAWIGVRVYRAARNIMRIATGQVPEQEPLNRRQATDPVDAGGPGGPTVSRRSSTSGSTPAPSLDPADVQDARFEDL